MHYKYIPIQTQGIYGTQIRHRNEGVQELGKVGEYVYIHTLDLGEQPEELQFLEVDLSAEEKSELLSQSHMKQNKATARGRIRGLKDIEDDLTDQKQIIQFMARGFVGLWMSLPQEIRDANPYKDNFDLFASVISTANFRLDLEDNQVEKITRIIQDEAEFATIVQDEYLGKIR